MNELSIPLGKKITIIAGQNATCKSTLLGMIGQPFGLKEKTIFNKPFSTKFSEIFKFSEKYDIPKGHEYEIYFYNTSKFGKESEIIKSYGRDRMSSSHIRLVTGKSRGRGEGNLDYPVIYLGLKRVYPIGELTNIEKMDINLSEDETDLFNDWYTRIFYPLEEISPIQITSKAQKDTLAVNSSNYDYFTNSAGQDNVGQILGSLISFKRLKNKLGGQYKGGILLIDEFDATLFPAAQTNLMDLFYNISGELNLQFVLTTHSLDVLDHVIEKRAHNPKILDNGNDTEILYFTKVHGDLELITSPTIERIRKDLKMAAVPLSNIIAEKINVYCEDAEAVWFSKRLLGRNNTRYLNFSNDTFGGSFLEELAKRNISEFKNSLIILDGDKSESKNKKQNILYLPDYKNNPENTFRIFLEKLPPNDNFWKNEYGYTKQVFSKELFDNTKNKYDRVNMKKWFNSQKKYWGRDSQLLYKRWAESNPETISAFNNNFIDAYNNIAKRNSVPTIPLNRP